MMWCWIEHASLRAEMLFWSIASTRCCSQPQRASHPGESASWQDAESAARAREGMLPVARKKQQVAQEDENERCEHHQDDPFEYPAHPSEPRSGREIERCKHHQDEPSEYPAVI